MKSTASASAVSPLILIDDDDWMDVYYSESEMLTAVEYPYISDEVEVVFDALARRVVLGVRGEAVFIQKVHDESDLAGLHSAALRFFRSWTEREAPPLLADPAAYVSQLVRDYRTTPTRRRKKRGQKDSL